MGYINHGTLQDVIDYAKLIKLQAEYCSKPQKVVCSRKSKCKSANKANKIILKRKKEKQP